MPAPPLPGARGARLPRLLLLRRVVQHVLRDDRLEVHVQRVPRRHHVLVVDDLDEGLRAPRARARASAAAAWAERPGACADKPPGKCAHGRRPQWLAAQLRKTARPLQDLRGTAGWHHLPQPYSRNKVPSLGSSGAQQSSSTCPTLPPQQTARPQGLRGTAGRQHLHRKSKHCHGGLHSAACRASLALAARLVSWGTSSVLDNAPGAPSAASSSPASSVRTA